jgi:sterol desaturase/sphingolipid hydroxylase (fatty acid hydroxylase superfamily)
MSSFPTEPAIRFGCFAGVLLLMTLWEAWTPRRRPGGGRVRWCSNLGLVVVDTLVVRLIAPLGAVGAALVAEGRGWGLFHNIPVPGWLAVALSVIALDLVIYLQHVMFHAVPLLWRMHMVHHADLEFDASTGVRFHPLEILLSLGIKMAAVVLLGVPALAVLLFEVLLNATSLFSHGNVCLPTGLDRLLRWVVVTPEMHRVHHSAVPWETNSNFGFNLPWWDYLLGTYRPQPASGHEAMTIGLTQMRDERQTGRLHRMLLLPFLGAVGAYPLNRRGEKEDRPHDDGRGTAGGLGPRCPAADLPAGRRP